MSWTVFIALAVVIVASVAIKLYLKRGADISRAQLQEWIEQKADIFILDVRAPQEYNSGYVPGAINMDHKEISARLDELKPYMDKDVVVYCELGLRARKAQTILKNAGFGRVYHLTGDMAGWRNAGLPMETPPTNPQE
ncbi:MAG: rhodanese-like domain-containing protein [Planctomycetota bacterium]